MDIVLNIAMPCLIKEGGKRGGDVYHLYPACHYSKCIGYIYYYYTTVIVLLQDKCREHGRLATTSIHKHAQMFIKRDTIIEESMC